MSYNISVKSLEKVVEFLNTLVGLRGEEVSWTTSDPRKLAYNIRQGMSVAAETEHPTYGELKKLYKITESAGKVTAKRLIPLVETHIHELTAVNFKKHINALNTPEVKDVMGVLGVLIENPGYEEYAFVDYTEPTDAELVKLWKWCGKNEYFLVKSSHVILTKNEAAKDIKWEPIQATA